MLNHVTGGPNGFFDISPLRVATSLETADLRMTRPQSRRPSLGSPLLIPFAAGKSGALPVIFRSDFHSEMLEQKYFSRRTWLPGLLLE